MRFIVFILFILLYTVPSLAQTVLSGQVQGNNGETLAGANLVAYSKEGKILTYATTDKKGLFKLNVPSAADHITVTYLGFDPLTIHPKELTNSPIFTLHEKAFKLREVAVTAESISERGDTLLNSVYPIVWMDAIHYKVTDERGCAVTRAIYNVLGIDKEGHKELYISRNEGANFWLSVLTDLQNRGVEDILIACIDGLKGFPDAIQSVYPNTAVQLCVVHQIRNSIKYVGSKNQKEFLKDLKCVYQAVNKESAENELLKLEEKWGEQYPIVIRSWQDNWDKLSEYFQYTPAIRKLIYTTNTVEGYHRQIRKVTKNKGVFPSDTALEKLVYLAYRNIRKKWTMPLANWATISQQLAIKFGDRFKLL